jgi:hypothetical protein
MANELNEEQKQMHELKSLVMNSVRSDSVVGYSIDEGGIDDLMEWIESRIAQAEQKAVEKGYKEGMERCLSCVFEADEERGDGTPYTEKKIGVWDIEELQEELRKLQGLEGEK